MNKLFINYKTSENKKYHHSAKVYSLHYPKQNDIKTSACYFWGDIQYILYRYIIIYQLLSFCINNVFFW